MTSAYRHPYDGAPMVTEVTSLPPVAPRLVPVRPSAAQTDLNTALNRTHDFLTTYVVFANPEQADAAALWVGHTWTYDQFDTTAYLAIESPEKRSGKTRLEECLSQVVREPLRSAGASLAALFRIIHR